MSLQGRDWAHQSFIFCLPQLKHGVEDGSGREAGRPRGRRGGSVPHSLASQPAAYCLGPEVRKSMHGNVGRHTLDSQPILDLFPLCTNTRKRSTTFMNFCCPWWYSWPTQPKWRMMSCPVPIHCIDFPYIPFYQLNLMQSLRTNAYCNLETCVINLQSALLGCDLMFLMLWQLHHNKCLKNWRFLTILSTSKGLSK